jgi:multidrug efflux pump subunit AcrA (membrane-fusion protein)
MLGMTSYVKIVIEVQQKVLAVPIDAVQYDDEGEYVMVFNRSSRDQTRVTIESGVIQGDQVVVSGDLRPGQQVVSFTPKPTESGSPFGGRD